MASIYNLKPAFQNLLRPIVKWLAHHHVTANQVTLSAMLISLITGLLILLLSYHHTIFLIIPFVLLIRMALNAIDGMLAREFKMQSNLGVFLNELGDVLSDTFLYLPFAYVAKIYPPLIIGIVIISIISEMTGVIALQVGSSRRYDGPMGKSDRAFAFSIISLLIAFNIMQNIWMNILLVIILLTLIITILNRIFNALKEVKSHGQ